jgi:hypothetical protein
VVEIMPLASFLRPTDLLAATEVSGWEALLAAGLVALIILVIYFYYLRGAQRRIGYLQQRYVRYPGNSYSSSQACPHCRFPMSSDQTICPKCKRLVGAMRYKQK